MGNPDRTLISLSKFHHIRGKRVRERTRERERWRTRVKKRGGLIRNRH